MREKENHESLIIIGQKGDGAECDYCMSQKHLKEIKTQKLVFPFLSPKQ